MKELIELSQRLSNSVNGEDLAKFETIRTIFYIGYKQLVSHKEVPAIEDLTQESKDCLWYKTRQIRGHQQFSREDCIKLSKALYALEYFLNEKP